MPKYTVQTKIGNAKIAIPKQVSKTVREIILTTLEQATDQNHIKQMIHEFENITLGVQVLMDHLKKDKASSDKSEELIKETIGIYLERGILMGKYVTGSPTNILKITRMPHPDLQVGLATMKKKERWISEYILHSFLLGKQCYETGLAISALISIEQQNHYLKKLEKEVSSYIW